MQFNAHQSRTMKPPTNKVRRKLKIVELLKQKDGEKTSKHEGSKAPYNFLRTKMRRRMEARSQAVNRKAAKAAHTKRNRPSGSKRRK